eukprot:1148284-Pelagomonas_calceolata.AAC.4
MELANPRQVHGHNLANVRGADTPRLAGRRCQSAQVLLLELVLLLHLLLVLLVLRAVQRHRLVDGGNGRRAQRGGAAVRQAACMRPCQQRRCSCRVGLVGCGGAAAACRAAAGQGGGGWG